MMEDSIQNGEIRTIIRQEIRREMDIREKMKQGIGDADDCTGTPLITTGGSYIHICSMCSTTKPRLSERKSTLREDYD